MSVYPAFISSSDKTALKTILQSIWLKDSGTALLLPSAEAACVMGAAIVKSISASCGTVYVFVISGYVSLMLTFPLLSAISDGAKA